MSHYQTPPHHESGVLATSSPGVTTVGVLTTYAIYNVGSGHYVVVVALRIPWHRASSLMPRNLTGSGTGTLFPRVDLRHQWQLDRPVNYPALRGHFSEDSLDGTSNR